MRDSVARMTAKKATILGFCGIAHCLKSDAARSLISLTPLQPASPMNLPTMASRQHPSAGRKAPLRSAGQLRRQNPRPDNRAGCMGYSGRIHQSVRERVRGQACCVTGNTLERRCRVQGWVACLAKVRASALGSTTNGRPSESAPTTNTGR